MSAAVLCGPVLNSHTRTCKRRESEQEYRTHKMRHMQTESKSTTVYTVGPRARARPSFDDSFGRKWGEVELAVDPHERFRKSSLVRKFLDLLAPLGRTPSKCR